MLQFGKKGIVSIITFSFIVLILILVLFFSYAYYADSKLKIESKMKKQELLNSLGNFRAAMLNLVSQGNSQMNYSNVLDSAEILFLLKNETVVATTLLQDQLVEINLSTLGVVFCGSYNVSPCVPTIINFNGSCVSIITA